MTYLDEDAEDESQNTGSNGKAGFVPIENRVDDAVPNESNASG